MKINSGKHCNYSRQTTSTMRVCLCTQNTSNVAECLCLHSRVNK